MRTLALELPVSEQCPKSFPCSDFCRVKQGGNGNVEAFLKALNVAALETWDRVYLTANGLTHNSPVFQTVIEIFSNSNTEIGILNPVLPDGVNPDWFELSLSAYHQDRWETVIKDVRSRFHGMLILSLVQPSELDPKFAFDLGADGILSRALQPEGNSSITLGDTELFLKAGTNFIPVSCYEELKKIGTCNWAINSIGLPVKHFGNLN